MEREASDGIWIGIPPPGLMGSNMIWSFGESRICLEPSMTQMTN